VAHGPLAVLDHSGAEASAPLVNLSESVKNVYPSKRFARQLLASLFSNPIMFAKDLCFILCNALRC